MAPVGMSHNTVAPAPMIAQGPIVIPGITVAPAPIQAPSPTVTLPHNDVSSPEKC